MKQRRLPDTGPSLASGNQQIDALTSTRAFAAILVCIHHFGPPELFPPYLHIGNIAVGYFFVLSGFVLYLAYHGRRVGYGSYLTRRVARIVPVYLLALALIIFPAERNFDCVVHSGRTLNEAILGAAMLQAYIPTYPLTLNLPAWTISVEMFFYLLFPLLLKFEQASIRRFLIFSVGLFALSQVIHLYYYPVRQNIGDTICDLVFFSPFIHLNQFLIGMLGGLIYTRFQNRIPRNAWLPVFIFLFCAGVIALRAMFPTYLSYQVGLIDPLFLLLILSIAVTNPRILRLRFFVFLGEISYGIYILQWPFYLYLAAMNERHWHMGPKRFFCIALTGLIAFAAVIYKLYELPVKRLINVLGKKFGSPAR